MEEKNIVSITTPTPNIVGQFNPHLIKNDFESLIYNKGYNVHHDKLIYCPCKTEKEGLFSVNCINCSGTGYVLVHRNKTKMVLQGMNYETKFKEWSEQKMGMVRITANQLDELNFMDRITLLDAETDFNQVIYPKKEGKDIYSPLFYEPIKIKDIFLFNGNNKELLKLNEQNYEIINNILFLKSDFEGQLRISIKYSHRPQFHIIDLLRDIIVSDTLNNLEEEKNAKFPTSAIGRRSHYVIDKQNTNLTYLNTNSSNSNLNNFSIEEKKC